MHSNSSGVKSLVGSKKRKGGLLNFYFKRGFNTLLLHACALARRIFLSLYVCLERSIVKGLTVKEEAVVNFITSGVKTLSEMSSNFNNN